MIKQSVSVLGIGTAVPRYSMNQEKAAEMIRSFSWDSAELDRWMPLIHQKSSVQQRSLVFLEEEGQALKPAKIFSPMKDSEDQGPSTEERMSIYKKEAAILAHEASRQAICEANVGLEDIHHLVTVSCTGFSAPGFDITLIQELGLSRAVSRTHIGFMGCHGVFNGLRVAHALALADKKGSVLLSAVELCSIHLAYGSDPGDMVANALFSDGASSAILSAQPSKKSGWRLAAMGSYLFPNSEHLMRWEIGNHGFRMHLSPEIPKTIEVNLKDVLTDWLKKSNLTISNIRSWAVHPGGPRILGAVESALQLPADALEVSKQILSQYGNMSSATILYIVDRLMEEQYETPCLALGFGPGLHLEMALFI